MNDEIERARMDILAGRSPRTINRSLELLGQFIDKTCEYSWIMPLWSYLCALSFDLSGNTEKAIEWYRTTWEENPNSPYAIMARTRLTPSP